MAVRSFVAKEIEVGSGVPTSTGAHPRVYIDDNTGVLYYRNDSGWNAVTGSFSGVASGYKIARGSSAFDGSNPTPIPHGLTTCIAAVATLVGSAAPGDNTSVVTALINGANVEYYAWKNTGGTDPTLVASTGTEAFYWMAIGV